MDNINQVFKDIVLEVTIDARLGSKGQAIETHATFFSHDVKTGLVKINIKKDGQPLPLPVGTKVIVSLTKPKEPGKGKLVYTPEIVDGNAGVVHWPIPEQIQGDVGEFRAGVYVRYPTDQRLHGGYFKFNKEISEIDENLEPWTESYWQGWADFQDEAEAAWTEWKANREHDWTQWTTTQQAKQDDFEAATNAQMSTVTKQLTELDAQTDELDQKQKDLIAQLADYMTKDQFVRFLAGETIEISGKCDLVGKVSGSVVENPHFTGTNTGSSLIIPTTATWYEFADGAYRAMDALGEPIYQNSTTLSGRTRQVILKWNLIEQINRDHPKLFASVGANDLAAKVAFVKKILTSFEMAAYGFGSGPSGNKMTSVIWNGAAWVYAHTTTAGTITKLGYRLTDPRFLNDDGFMYNLVYAEPSDGTTASSVSIDYAQLAYSLKLSLYDFVPKKGEAMIYRGVYTIGQTLDPDTLPKLPGYWEIKGATLNSRFPSGTHNYGVLEQKVSPDGNSIYQNYNPEGTVYSDSVQGLDRNSQANGSWGTTNFAPTIGYRFSELVATHGAQTIGGAKNFLETPTINGKPVLMTDDTGWVNVPINAGYYGWFYVRKANGMITWRYYVGLGTNSAGPNAVVCTIPEGFRTTVNHTKNLGGNTTNSTADVRFETNGNVIIRATNASAVNFGNLESFGDFPSPN